MAFAIDGPGHLNRRFTDGNPVTALEATVVGADWLNMVQDELLGLVAGAGLTASKVDNGQVFAAVRAMILQQAGLIGDLRNTDVGNLLGLISGLTGRVGTLEGKTGGRLLAVRAYDRRGVYRHYFASGCKLAVYELVGGGAAGGGGPIPSAGQALVGSGGGSGGYTSGLLVDPLVNAGPYVDITVGAGGGPQQANNGLPGGATSFGGWAAALGGSFGSTFGFTDRGVGGSGAGAPPGSILNRDGVSGGIRVTGGAPGHTGIIIHTGAAIGGAGGAGPWGGGGAEVGRNSSGANATGYGSGGGGCCLLAGEGPGWGGAGADGHVLVREFA